MTVGFCRSFWKEIQISFGEGRDYCGWAESLYRIFYLLHGPWEEVKRLLSEVLWLDVLAWVIRISLNL